MWYRFDYWLNKGNNHLLGGWQAGYESADSSWMDYNEMKKYFKDEELEDIDVKMYVKQGEHGIVRTFEKKNVPLWHLKGIGHVETYQDIVTFSPKLLGVLGKDYKEFKYKWEISGKKVLPKGDDEFGSYPTCDGVLDENYWVKVTMKIGENGEVQSESYHYNDTNIY